MFNPAASLLVAHLANCREADCRLKGGENNDAMNAYHNAAKSYKKSDPEGELCMSSATSHHDLIS